MDDQALLRASARNMAEMWAHVAETSGGRVQRWDDAVAADAGAPNPVPNRLTLISPPPADGGDLLSRARTFFSGTPAWGIADPWAAADFSSDMTLIVKMPVMVRMPGPGKDIAGSAIRMERAQDSAGMEAFRRALFTGFHVVDWSLASPDLFARSFVSDPRFTAWVAYDDGEPIGTAVSLVAEGVVGVYLVSTHPSRRGRGIGEDLSWAATRAHPSLPAMLQASPMGFPVYQRMGYRVIGSCPYWGSTAVKPAEQDHERA